MIVIMQGDANVESIISIVTKRDERLNWLRVSRVAEKNADTWSIDLKEYRKLTPGKQ